MPCAVLRNLSNSRFSVQEHENVTMEEDGDETWRVGPGRITAADLMLVRLDHVSKGSWQAQLRLVRPLQFS